MVALQRYFEETDRSRPWFFACARLYDALSFGRCRDPVAALVVRDAPNTHSRSSVSGTGVENVTAGMSTGRGSRSPTDPSSPPNFLSAMAADWSLYGACVGGAYPRRHAAPVDGTRSATTCPYVWN